MEILKTRSISRREAIAWMISAAAVVSALDLEAGDLPGLPTGIGMDPDLHKKIIPWDRVLTGAEMKTVTALCDVIIPADDVSPSASAVGVPDFVNEWVSAPYTAQQDDLRQLREGFQWLDEEARTRFGKEFADLAPEQMTQICDLIHFTTTAKKEHKKAAGFFSRMRVLVAGGFYTTPEGWKDIGYVGNVPMAEFPGPPPEVLRHVGLA